MYNDKGNTKYLKLLKQNYSSSQDVIREIVNLSAIINLPKGTEFFLSDIHGEYEAFLHIMNNCSGVIKEKVDLIFKDTISDYDRQELCTLIYYPREKMALLDEQGKIDSDWYAMTLNQLILVAKLLSSKYTRSKVRKALPEEYAYIIDELLHAQEDEDANQVRYHKQILKTIIDLEDADEFIIALSALIKRLAVDHLHIVGDVFDRGGSADKILDLLYDYHSLDIEWGNHDILWMGAACGNDACICNVIRNNLKYNNVEILENAYGISLRQLMLFGMKTYGIEDGIEAARAAYVDNPYKDDVDFMWFLWGGEKSPLCGRRLKTFEMEYVTDKSMWEEPSNPYYSRYYDKSFCCQILHEFGLYDDDAHIINGHTPVHAIEGENPVRANGKLFVIDGGFCRAMNKKTGIAGYTLIYNSHGLRLRAHTPFTSVEDALINNTDIETSSEVEENDKRRMLVEDTDIGKRLIGEIDDLHKLLENYRRL